MIIDLNKLFPEPKIGCPRGPLPKQKEFLREALDPNASKYILYAGGVGSGKSVVGCVSIISMAVQYPGTYLIGRLYMPELRTTTYKTFLDLCPKELIIQHRIADAIIHLRSIGGKSSEILFRPMEDPEKHRSLNLNAAYLDESSQISESGFVILQSRLRGPHVRKIIMTTNVQGHDWQHERFVKQDGFGAEAKKMFRLVEAPSTENIHLPEGYVESLLKTYSEDQIKRDIYANWDSFAGQIFSEFRRDVHVIRPFAVPDDWTRIAGVDHGYRNPACMVWGAVDYDENIYVYREFYEKEWLIKEICKGKPEINKPGLVSLNGKDKLVVAAIDPSVKATRGQTGTSDWDTYAEHLPTGFPLQLANNDVRPGIDRVKEYLKIEPRTGKPRLFIFNTCNRLIDEMTQYRWSEMRETQVGEKNEREHPKKVNDHACFAAGTPILQEFSHRRIEALRPGDRVRTPKGMRRVTAVACTGVKDVWDYTFSTGPQQTTRATPDHPFWTTTGLKPVGELGRTDLILDTSGEASTRLLRKKYAGQEPVYNITVEGEHVYYVGDLLVSNCDALRYMVMTRPEPPKLSMLEWTKKVTYGSLEGSLCRDLEKIRRPVNSGDPFET